jgi:glutaredoxin 3
MKPVTIYTKDYCPYCTNAKNLLRAKGVGFSEIDLTQKPEELKQLIARTGMRTVPQIFFADQLIGGYDDLAKLNQQQDILKLLDDSNVSKDSKAS